MTSTTFFFIFIPLLAVILLAVNIIFAPHNPYQEKNSTFECGFHSFLGQNRTQFSISFFIFALLFLLFDLEILLVYPYVVSAYTNAIYGLVIMLIFFLALTLGFAFELGKNALKIDSRQIVTFINKKTERSFVSTSSFKGLYFIISKIKVIVKGILTNFTLTKFLSAVFTIFIVALIKLYYSGNLHLDYSDLPGNIAIGVASWTINTGIAGLLGEYFGTKGININLHQFIYGWDTMGPKEGVYFKKMGIYGADSESESSNSGNEGGSGSRPRSNDGNNPVGGGGSNDDNNPSEGSNDDNNPSEGSNRGNKGKGKAIDQGNYSESKGKGKAIDQGNNSESESNIPKKLDKGKGRALSPVDVEPIANKRVRKHPLFGDYTFYMDGEREWLERIVDLERSLYAAREARNAYLSELMRSSNPGYLFEAVQAENKIIRGLVKQIESNIKGSFPAYGEDSFLAKYSKMSLAAYAEEREMGRFKTPSIPYSTPPSSIGGSLPVSGQASPIAGPSSPIAGPSRASSSGSGFPPYDSDDYRSDREKLKKGESSKPKK